MKKLIILIELVTILLLLSIPKVRVGAEAEPKYFIMNVTAYSNHPNCISDKWRDGKTALNTPIREGIAAINVDYVNGEWEIKSPLRLGDRIYIEDIGNYDVEDTGRFSEKDKMQDIWTVDIYMEDYQEAVEFGKRLKKVFVIN